MIPSKTLLAFFLKDLEDALRSHTIVLVLAGPVLLSVLFSRAFGDKDLRRPLLAVHQVGDSKLVRILQRGNTVRIESFQDWAAARQAVEEGQAVAALGLPADFDAQLEKDTFPRLNLLVDAVRTGPVAVTRQALRSALAEMAGHEVPADVRVEKVRSLGLERGRTMLPTWVIFAALSGLMITSSSLVEEKESGSLAQVLTAPVSMVEVVMGKIGAGWLLASLASLLILALNGVGTGLEVCSLILIGCLAFSAIGVLIGLVARGMSAANAATSAVFMIIFIPVALADFSQLMHRIAVVSPAFYLHRGVTHAMVGDVTGWWIDFSVLMLVFVSILSFGAWWLRRGR